MTQSHANYTGNAGKQRDAQAGVNRFTKTMNRHETQTAEASQTSQTFPLTNTNRGLFFPLFTFFFLHPVRYPLSGHTAAATADALT